MGRTCRLAILILGLIGAVAAEGARPFATRLRQLKGLLTEGRKSGEIRIDSPSNAVLARCVLDVLWIPENILRAAGRRAALVHARDTVLRGVARRSTPEG